MAPSLADQIEAYLKHLLNVSEVGFIELRRQFLAERFACVPSQINYVLATRFTDRHGYIIETRRGGGGYIKIIEMEISQDRLNVLLNKIGTTLCQQSAEAFITRFKEEKLLSEREAKLMKVLINRDNLDIDLPERDQVRAKLLKAMLKELLRRDMHSL